MFIVHANSLRIGSLILTTKKVICVTHCNNKNFILFFAFVNNLNLKCSLL